MTTSVVEVGTNTVEVTEVGPPTVVVVEVTCAPRSSVLLGLIIGPAVADATALNALTGMVQNEAHLRLDNFHLYVWNGTSWDDWGDQRPNTPHPLYTITGATATLPGSEVAVADYASMAALLAAAPPTYQGQMIQVAEDTRVKLYQGRWVAGAWDWAEVPV